MVARSLDSKDATPLELEARSALDGTGADPAEAARRAAGVLAKAEVSGDIVASVIALRALALVSRDSGRLNEATRHFKRAIALAEDAGLRSLAGEVRMSYAPTLLFRGDGAGAVAECDRAIALLAGLPRARALVQRASLAKDTGDEDAALAGYERVLPVLRRHGDRRWEALVLHNRALVRWARRDFAAAAADWRRAARLEDELGLTVAAARTIEHEGRVQAALGRVPEALRLFADADRRVRSLLLDDPLMQSDRSAVLLSARLGEEALAAATAAADSMRASGDHFRLAETLLVQADAALLMGDAGLAVRASDEARTEFRRRKLNGQAALAELAALRARLADQPADQAIVISARRVARQLWGAGLLAPAMDASVIVGQLELGLGRTAAAERSLRPAAQRRLTGPALERMTGWHAEALRRLAVRDRAGAQRAARAGLQLADSHRATLGATELRARSSGFATELASLGMRLALDSGRPRDVLVWAERWRAGALRSAPVSQPSDRRLALDLAELRAVSAAAEAAVLDGTDPGPLRKQQQKLESAVQARTRQAKADRGGAAGLPPVRAVLAGLGERVLVELIESDGRLHAVAASNRRVEVVALGDIAIVTAEVDAHRFALRRATLRRGSSPSIAAADRALADSAERIDRLVLEPLGSRLDGGGVVIVPIGVLHGVAWPSLPTLRDRPVTVAPSAALWHRASLARWPAGSPVLVAGPRLLGAADEVTALADIYPAAACFGPDGARADAVVRALSGARFAHLAAHGTFRADNPMFSTIELTDGALTVYDFEALRRAPGMVVLSACESGRSSLHPGDELMGLAASLLAMGSRTLIASLVPVPDAQTRPLMISFHPQLRSGRGPAAALAAAQAQARGTGDPAALAGAVSFVCLGAD